MKNVDEKTRYRILDYEIKNLENEPKVFYYDLGRGLLNMKKNNLFQLGEYSKFKHYIEEEISFSWNKAGDLIRIYKYYSNAFDQCSPWNTASERVILSKAGWAKAIELKNRKYKYTEALDKGFLDVKEILFYGSLVTKETLIWTLENYDGPALWIRIYSKIYFPEILRRSETLEDLYKLADKEIIRRLSKNLESQALQFDDREPCTLKANCYPKGIPKNLQTYLDIFLKLRQLERKLAACLALTFSSLRYDPLANKVGSKSERNIKYNLTLYPKPERNIKYNLTSYVDSGIENKFFLGPQIVAEELNVDLDNVAEWINFAGLNLSSRYERIEPGFSEFEYIDKLQNGDIQPKDLKFATRLSKEELPMFTIAELIGGYYIKAFIDSGDSEEKALDKAKKLLPAIKKWNLVSPLIEIAGGIDVRKSLVGFDKA